MPTEDDKKSQSAYDGITRSLKTSLVRNIEDLSALDTKDLLERRYKKFRNMGEWVA